jgi:hypothetical protein
MGVPAWFADTGIGRAKKVSPCSQKLLFPVTIRIIITSYQNNLDLRVFACIFG